MKEVVSIRAATSEDAETLHRAVVAIAENMDERHRVTSTVDEIRTHGFGAKPAFEALIAEVGTEVAGVCIHFASFSTFRGRPGVYVQDLYVDPRWRKLGIGAKLLQGLAAQTRRRGGAYLRLSVDVDNVAAQGFYEKLGVGHSSGERIHAAYDSAFTTLADAGDDLEIEESP